MGSIFDFFDKSESNYNPESYSCIPKIENDYNDLSYKELKDEINKHVKIIKRKEKNKDFSYKDYNEEFYILENNIDDDPNHYRALEKGIQELCRYSDIKTYKHNNLEINTKTKYINASPIRINNNFLFISTQGPLPNTIEHFWTMVDQYNCNLVLMLCNLKELGREKCANYWDINKIGNYTIKSKEIENDNIDKNIIVEREITIKNNLTNNEKTITQIHYKGWPDHGAPDIKDSYKDFLYMIKKVDTIKNENPTVVHCSAGVGRTGTFISIYCLFKEIMSQIKNENLENIHFSVFNMVRKLKEMRLLMVQTNEQYKFIYDFIDCLLKEYNI